MKVVSALLIVPAAVALATPAQADSGGGDVDFLATLGQAGIGFATGDQVVAVGKGVCSQLDRGQSATDVVKNLTDANPGFTPRSAAKFAVIATGAYCPKYLGDGGGGADTADNGAGQTPNGAGQAPNERGGGDAGIVIAGGE